MTVFPQDARSIRAAAVFAILALLVSTTIEIGSSKTTDNPGTDIPEKASTKKISSKKTTKQQSKETVMQNLNTLMMRVKVGGTKVVLLLAGVRPRSST